MHRQSSESPSYSSQDEGSQTQRLRYYWRKPDINPLLFQLDIYNFLCRKILFPVLSCSVVFCHVLSCSVVFCLVLSCSVVFCLVLKSRQNTTEQDRTRQNKTEHDRTGNRIFLHKKIINVQLKQQWYI